MTPHINAKKEDIAKVVIMPGDPLRAKYIAENFLENFKLVNSVRNMFIYTGTYKNKQVTIAGSGMGCASIGIYSYELYKFYDVDTIIRIGSAGSYDKDLNVYDILNVRCAYGESSFAKIAAGIDQKMLQSSTSTYDLINQTAKNLNLTVHNGDIHSSDVFYRLNNDDYITLRKEKNLVAVEMESFALFANAKVTNKKAACILTISDSFITNQVTSAEEREKNFNNMMHLALETVLNIGE